VVKPKNLGEWREYSVRTYGEHAPATKYLDESITEATFGKNKEVHADTDEFRQLLSQLNKGGLHVS
jgi:hypothetical protein